MAAEKTTTRARIESIKTDLRSISTCSTSTVVDVQELLADKTEDIVQKENIRARSSQLRSGQTTTRKKTASTTVITTAKLASHSLAPRDKYILATEVANLTLKSLADALKSPPSGVFPKTKSTSNGDAPQSAKSNSPLQERFVSQVTNSPTKLLRSPSNVSCLTTGSGSGLVATAECARVAFAYMRTPEAMKAGGKQALQLQLENGMSALVGKMVAHGLDNLAIKELRVLKRRLDYILETTRLEDRTTSSKVVPKKVSNVQEKESIAALLDFGDINPNTTALPLIIAHQTHALRIIARSKRPLLIEETWQYLKTSHSSSLVNLLSQAATVANAEPKSLRQLESLAQTLLSMCPSISSAEDCSSGQDHLYLSPETVLSLQHLAFKVRQTWWKLAKHQVNEEKELFEPFSRCVVAFSRRSKLTAAAKYKIVDRLYQELLENAEGPVNGESKNCPSSGDATTKCLSALAQSAGLTDEAIRWLGTSKPSKTVNDSAVKMAPRLVRVAAISLDACLRGTSKTDIEKSFENALDAFSGGLSGSPTELEVLFAEVNSLRRIAAKAIFLHVQDPSNTTIPPQLLPQILRMASAGLHFTVRYLNTNISADTNRKAQNRHDQRFASVAKHTKSIVDTACLCSKLAAIGDADSHWSLMHTLFQNCLSIIRSLEVCPETGSSDNLQNPFVKISNAYWAVHLQLKMADGITMSSIMAMQASVDLLRDRSVRERQAGLIIMKLERLAEAYDALGRMEKSRETLKSCIATLIEFGDLQAATELGESQPISDIFSNEGTGSILGRVVKACQRTFIKAPPRRADELAYFDDSTLPAASRGLLLEWQLALFVRALSRNISWDPALHNSVERLSAQLLELYEPVQYPIRRQRVILMLLQLLREHPVLFSKQILPLDTVWEPNKDVSKSQDQALARYQCHLSALLKLKTALQESDLPMSTIEQCLSAWQSLTGSGTSWNDLTNNVDSIGDWVSELHTLADHLAAKGEDYSCIVALRLIARIFELEDNVDASRLITSLCALGLQLLRLGYTNKVAQIFSKVEHLVSRENTSTEAKLQWHIVYAEYLVEIGNLSKCESILRRAEALSLGDTQFMDLAKSSTTMSGRLRFNRVLADACYVYSLLSIRIGRFKDAARHAKQCVTVNRRIWAALESKSAAKRAVRPDNTESDAEGSNTETFDPLSSIRNDQGLPVVISNTHSSLDGPEFWSLVPSLYRGLMQQSLVFTHQGLLQEAMYVAEQAEKVAAATNSRALALDNVSRRADYWAQSGKSDKAQAALKNVDINSGLVHPSMLGYHSSVARIYHADRMYDEELGAYTAMETMVNKLVLPPLLGETHYDDPAMDQLTQKMSAIGLQQTATKGKPPIKTTKARKPVQSTVRVPTKPLTRTAQNPSRKALPPSDTQPSSTAEDFSSLTAIRLEVLGRKALARLAQEDVVQASKFLDEASALSNGLEGSYLHSWARFRALLMGSMKKLSSDFTFNTLPESTIAFPALNQKAHQSPEWPTTKRVNVAPTKAKRTTKVSKISKQEFVTTLEEAREQLAELHKICAQTGASYSFQQASSALSSITVLLSAISGGEVHGSLHPLYVAYMNELPRGHSLRLCQESIEVEQESLSRDQYLKWPKIATSEKQTLGSASDFQRDYIDIIPSSWTTISLSLNEAQDELYLTRYESGFSPFILRLPLSRHASREMDEQEFTFEDGKRDLEETIELSDFSTRSAKDMVSREARMQWWTEREALDTKLHELLLNMENIWLGGFKGIFSSHVRQPALLARFKKSFENVLNRHLPSRRGKKQQNQPTLDTRIFELFVGLGDATNEELDMDDALMDLIYFVVDVLHFNGEHNAYDEIEFDTMVIETLDALRAYHNACAGVSVDSAHTILILDKSLHIFPWESLPCLQSLSISRLPSMAALRERLLAARPSNSTKDAPPGHYISADTGGTSILNPSGDLSHTLKTLKPRLDCMPGQWTHIANRAPSEKEFESALKDKDLALYFGHGSGAQFVRSKSVRRLYPGTETGQHAKPGCATTFLFGCSSAHLTENGIYESSGMLASYLVAGAPAVVGMLWDVTDKDCDRFAVKTGELWGLWPELKEEVDVPKTANKKGKGKGKAVHVVAEMEGARGTGTAKSTRKGRGASPNEGQQASGVGKVRRGVGLNEAVREARDVCVLRYLNGAAAVVYGIPVYLE